MVHAVAVKRHRLHFDGCAALRGTDGSAPSPLLTAYCRLAEACTAFSPTDRPSAAEIVTTLIGLLDQCESGPSRLPTVMSMDSAARP